MLIIDSPLAMARARATFMNPWLRRLLAVRDRQVFDAGCRVGDLGPIVVVDSGDTLAQVEAAAGLPIATNMVDGVSYPDPDYTPSWEWCEGDHGWYEILYVTADDGGGAVILVPDRDGVDPTLRALVQTYADSH